MRGLFNWLPIIAALIGLLSGLFRYSRGYKFGGWIALGSALFLLSAGLLLVKESQVDLIADSEDGRMIVGMLLETVYFGISSTGMALMFLAIVADRPSSKDSPTDPEKYLARLAKTIWSMYRNYRQGKR